MAAPRSLTAHILVVEDEPSIATLLRYNLEAEGFVVRVESRGDDALFALEERLPDLVVLDWMLPGKSGVDVLRAMRHDTRFASLPVILLTARGEEVDKLTGLDSGADDYMVKPFSPKELVARVKAMLRRSKPVLSKRQLQYHDFLMDVDGNRLLYGEVVIALAPSEWRMMQFFLEHPERVYSREQLLQQAWADDSEIDERTVDVHIARLRRCLAAGVAGLDAWIETVRGRGYQLRQP
jgi:two-component system, OmpR family, phosphate regulon response regulator PhoB